MIRSRRALLLRAMLICSSALALPFVSAIACISTGKVVDSTTGAGGAGDDGTICALRNCQSNHDCSACSEHRHVCAELGHRCVVCVSDADCTPGETCTPVGTCAPSGLECPADDYGVPIIDCETSADCAACDVAFHVCDAATSKCVACTPDDMSGCQPTEICTLANVCFATCPPDCAVDSDCTACSAAGGPPVACTDGHCAVGDGGPTTQVGLCHDECTFGAAMSKDCSDCATTVCASDSSCCSDKWDLACLGKVTMLCGKACDLCTHSPCVTGLPIAKDCSSCTKAVCTIDPSCCSTDWDKSCVSVANVLCFLKC